MSRRPRFPLTALILLLGLALPLAPPLSPALAGLGSLAGPSAGRGADDRVGAAPAHHACDPVASREVEPRGASMGTSVQVRVSLAYRCRAEHRPVHFLLLVENSAKTAPSGGEGRDLLAHLREGLANFVQEMDYAQGAEGGLILYHGNVAVHQPLAGGEGGQRALLSAIDRFGTTANQSARAAGEAIVKGTELLAASQAVSEAMKVLLIVDTGGTLTNADVDAVEACRAARAAGLHVAVFALETAGDRLKDCADPTSFRGSSRDRGQDIPDILQALGKGFAHGHQLERLSLEETLGPQWEYMEGSGMPVEPERFGNDLTWPFSPPGPAGSHVFSFRAKVREGPSREIVPVSERAAFMLYYYDTAAVELTLANPEVCIAPPGNPAWCKGFFATLTPPAPTGTPSAPPPPTATEPARETPGPTPTAEPPSATAPSPTRTRSAAPTGRPIYLPLALKAGDLR